MDANPSPAPTAGRIALPRAAILIAERGSAVLLDPDGELHQLSAKEAGEHAHASPPIVCHARATQRRLATTPFAAYDLLELFAFVRPAQFCVPTPRGLARALGLKVPDDPDSMAFAMLEAAQKLLREARALDASAHNIAVAMTRANWPWGPSLLAAMNIETSGTRTGSQAGSLGDALKVWQKLPEWVETPPPPPPTHHSVSIGEVRQRLESLLLDDAESRPQQVDYALAAAGAFQPTDTRGNPRVVVAEAGTGVGKTLGYLAPASVWADKNESAVWLSTYTRNLQRQLDGEIDKLYPDRAEKALRAVVRKGRENYLCLLNFEDALKEGQAGDLITLGLVARWIQGTRDGDMIGGDFPAWLGDLLGRRRTVELTDTRGECIYSACSHYGKCFIEKSVRRARRARLVIANHALVMVQAALGPDDQTRPLRYVFDEGHHLFDAADSAFSAHLTGLEAAELRRWLLGAERRRSGRTRGLKARLDGLIEDDKKAGEAVDEIERWAHGLPGPSWMQRIASAGAHGPVETFLARAHQQVYARDRNAGSAYGLEADASPPVDGLVEAAQDLAQHLAKLRPSVQTLIGCLQRKLDEESDTLDTQTRTRIESVTRSLERRAIAGVESWRSMLTSLSETPSESFVDFFGLERIEGRDVDVGLHRHFTDPMRPFAQTMTDVAHGMLITSATLRDKRETDSAAMWDAAAARTGARHLGDSVDYAGVSSPFDYPAQTRVRVINDIAKDNNDQIASVYRELILAAGGGVLGLFTSIARLRAVHAKLADDPKLKHLTLLAQHVDPLDTGTLVDIFRAEEDSCLFGTDAIRDGVDVPGHSLRMIVFDRVPWPRPTILHRARKAYFSDFSYDDMITRLKLKQAFGRLVRRADDRGMFVMLDKAMPSRLCDAFPEGVAVERAGLKDTLEAAKEFFGKTPPKS